MGVIVVSTVYAYLQIYMCICCVCCIAILISCLCYLNITVYLHTIFHISLFLSLSYYSLSLSHSFLFLSLSHFFLFSLCCFVFLLSLILDHPFFIFLLFQFHCFRSLYPVHVVAVPVVHIRVCAFVVCHLFQ